MEIDLGSLENARHFGRIDQLCLHLFAHHMDLRLLAAHEASDAGVDEIHQPGDGSGGYFQCFLLRVLETVNQTQRLRPMDETFPSLISKSAYKVRGSEGIIRR